MKKITLLLSLVAVALFTACGEDSKKEAAEAAAKTVENASIADEEEAIKKAAEITQKVAKEKAEEMAEVAKSEVDDASDAAKDALEDVKEAIYDASVPDKD